MSANTDLKEIVDELKRYLEFQKSMGVKTVFTQNTQAINDVPVISKKKEPRTEAMTKNNNPAEEEIITIEGPAGLFDGSLLLG